MALFIIFFLIIMLLFTLLFILRISKAISRFVAVFIDFLFVGGFTAYFLHDKVSMKIASGNAVYFWDIVFGIIVCILYYALLSFLVNKLPRVAACINYVIAWFGTFLIYILVFLIFNDGLPELLNNHSWSMFIHLLIVSLLAFVTFQIRKNIFDTE